MRSIPAATQAAVSAPSTWLTQPKMKLSAHTRGMRCRADQAIAVATSNELARKCVMALPITTARESGQIQTFGAPPSSR